MSSSQTTIETKQEAVNRIIDTYSAQLEALISEYGDIMKGLQNSGKTFYGFKFSCDNRILKDLFYIKSYVHEDSEIFVFVGKKDRNFYITAKPLNKIKAD